MQHNIAICSYKFTIRPITERSMQRKRDVRHNFLKRFISTVENIENLDPSKLYIKPHSADYFPKE